MFRRAGISVVFFILLAISGRTPLAAQLTYPFPESSLGGAVKSPDGNPLEGIVVRAKQENSHIAYSVVSNAQGVYRFPKLDPGKYLVEIARADGLEPDRKNADIRAGQEAKVDFALGRAKDMEAQITSAEWLMSIPGRPEQKRLISDECFHCHTGNIQAFRFDKDGWAKVVRLMLGMGMSHSDRGVPRPARNRPGFEERVQVIADYLAQVRGPEAVDMSNAKVLRRPTGASTRVMYTEYTIPYPNAELHDVDVDKNGTVWWTDWRWPYLGRLNPETGEMKYWETPPVPNHEDFPGAHEIAFDKDENPWVSMVWSGGILKFDRNTEKMEIFSTPENATTQAIGVDHERGRVWFGLNEDLGPGTDHAAYYVPETKEYKVFKDFPSYGMVTDSQGNAYGMLRGKMSHIGRIDAETLNRVDYPTPTPNAFPRRGDYDSQDRIWFAEYSAAQLGMLDPKTGTVREWKIDLKPFGLETDPDFVGPHPPSGDHHQIGSPYGLGVDRSTDEVWLELFRLDRLVKFNSKTEEMTHYSLPERHVMSRSPRMDPKSRAGHSIMWMGTLPKHGNGKILKVETW